MKNLGCSEVPMKEGKKRLIPKERTKVSMRDKETRDRALGVAVHLREEGGMTQERSPSLRVLSLPRAPSSLQGPPARRRGRHLFWTRGLDPCTFEGPSLSVYPLSTHSTPSAPTQSLSPRPPPQPRSGKTCLLLRAFPPPTPELPKHQAQGWALTGTC